MEADSEPQMWSKNQHIISAIIVFVVILIILGSLYFWGFKDGEFDFSALEVFLLSLLSIGATAGLAITYGKYNAIKILTN